MSTGESEVPVWTGQEIADLTGNVTNDVMRIGAILRAYCDGDMEPVYAEMGYQEGNYVPPPDVIADFIRQMKRTLAYILRRAADALDERPMPPPPEQPQPPEE